MKFEVKNGGFSYGSRKILEDIDVDRDDLFKLDNSNYMEDIINQININVKYDGYIKRQQQQVKAFKKMESRRIPDDINTKDILKVINLLNELRKSLFYLTN